MRLCVLLLKVIYLWVHYSKQIHYILFVLCINVTESEAESGKSPKKHLAICFERSRSKVRLHSGQGESLWGTNAVISCGVCV